MAEVHGKAGKVYGNPLTILPTSATWDAGAGSAVSNVAGKVGGASGATRATTTGVGATTILQSDDISSTDLSAYEGVLFWARSSVTTAAGDLQFMLAEDSTIATPVESMDMPILTAATWQHVFNRFAAATATRDAILSGGIYQVTDLADGTFDLDLIQAVQEIDGAKSWTLSYDADVVETTDFGDAGIKTFIAGGSGWTGSFNSNKFGAPLSIGTETTLILAESVTDSQEWSGQAIITNVTPNTDVADVVTYAYTFQGTADLQVAVT